MDNNKEEVIERLIKDYLEKKEPRLQPSPQENCPSELELSDYLQGRLTTEKESWLLAHLGLCRHCLSLLALAQEMPEKDSIERPTLQMLRRAKSIMQKESPKAAFASKWPALACISFICSFIFTRYFLQCLALAVIFSLKWIFDTGSTRTLIMVCEAWRNKDQNTAQRIIQDFRDRISQRK